MKNIPQNIQKLLDQIKKDLAEILDDDLVGIYLHGSLVMGCFNPDSSDIDFLIVVKKKLDIETKKKIIKLLLDLAEKDSQKKLEMSVVLQSTLDHFQYPTPFELHYSDDWKEKYRAGQVDLNEEKTDPDLAAHFVITKERGVCLIGKPIADVFPDIPKEIYLESLLHDANWILDNIAKGQDEGECLVPVYGVLNLCRVLAFINAGRITSKSEGGEWGLKNLPKEYQSLIQQAFNQYTNAGVVKKVDACLLKQFADYVRDRF